MSHQVESMFSTKATPWHGLGQVLENPPTVADAIRQAGLDWEVGFYPMTISLPGGATELAAHRAVYRKDTGKVLGEVGPRYVPLQNSKKFEWFQPFVEGGLATLETAGSLDEGRKTWVLAKLCKPNAEIIPGDEIVKFLLLSDSFDGTMAVRVGFSPVRVVCANTLGMAHRDRESKLLRIRHSGRTAQALEVAREAVNLADATFEATAEQYRKLARCRVNPSDLRKYVQVVLGLQPTEKSGDKLSTRAENIIADILARADHGLGTGIKDVPGTWWAAFNAVTEFTSHVRGSDAGRRLDSLWFGSGQKINDQALATALEMAQAS